MTLGRSGERTIIVSPHLDDAILSLGASISRATRAGLSVEVVTVFAGNVASDAIAGPWDARAGFRTEGDASARRRAEDRRACSFVGGVATWLDFRDRDYRDRWDPDGVWSAVCACVEGADTVLLPGFPLLNRDHDRLTTTLVERGLRVPRVGLYAEQPYTYRVRRATSPSPATSEAFRALGVGPGPWTPLRNGVRDVNAKRRAVLAYCSQLPLLGLATRRSLTRLLLHELVTGESVMWASR